MRFYPNVTTLHSGIFYRKSPCLSSVCNVRAPYSWGWNFEQYFFATVYPSHPMTFVQDVTESSQGTPSSKALNARGVDKITEIALTYSTKRIFYESGDYRQDNSLWQKHGQWIHNAIFVNLRPLYVTDMRYLEECLGIVCRSIYIVRG